MIDLIIVSSLTLFENESRKRDKPVLSKPDFVKIDSYKFGRVSSFLHNAWPPIFFGLFQGLEIILSNDIEGWNWVICIETNKDFEPGVPGSVPACAGNDGMPFVKANFLPSYWLVKHMNHV